MVTHSATVTMEQRRRHSLESGTANFKGSGASGSRGGAPVGDLGTKSTSVYKSLHTYYIAAVETVSRVLIM